MAVYEQELDRIVIRIVYDGPGRAGKTTNIQQLAELFGGENPDLQLLAADNGHTTYFDWLSFDGGMIDGHHLLIQVVGVPGAKRFEHRRAHILRSADAIVLVCDSTPGTAEMARETLDSQREHLGRRADQVPVIVQANKQDLANALQAHEVGAALGLPYEVPVLGAEATAGIGTRETAVHAIRAAVRLVKRRTAKPGIQSIAGKAGTLAALRAALDTAIVEPDDIDPTSLIVAPPTATPGRKVFRPTTVDEPHLVYVHNQSPTVQAAKIRVGEPGDEDAIAPGPPRPGANARNPPEQQPSFDPNETLPSHPIIIDEPPGEQPAKPARGKRRRDTETTEGRVQRNRKERSTQSSEKAPTRPAAPAATPATPARPGTAPRKIPPRRRTEPGATRPPSGSVPSATPTIPPNNPSDSGSHPVDNRSSYPSDSGSYPADGRTPDRSSYPSDSGSYPVDGRTPSGNYPAAPDPRSVPYPPQDPRAYQDPRSVPYPQDPRAIPYPPQDPRAVPYPGQDPRSYPPSPTYPPQDPRAYPPPDPRSYPPQDLRGNFPAAPDPRYPAYPAPDPRGYPAPQDPRSYPAPPDPRSYPAPQDPRGNFPPDPRAVQQPPPAYPPTPQPDTRTPSGNYPAQPDTRTPSGNYPAVPALPVVPDARTPSGTYPAVPAIPDARTPSGTYPAATVIPDLRPPVVNVPQAGDRPPSGSVPIIPNLRAPSGDRPSAAPVPRFRPPSSPTTAPPASPPIVAPSAVTTAAHPAAHPAAPPVQPAEPVVTIVAPQPTEVSPTARTLVSFTPQEAALLGLPPLHQRGPAGTPSAFVDDDLSPRPAAPDLPPHADLPAGHVWPVPGGRDVLAALAAVTVPRVALPTAGHFTAGPYHLTTRRFADEEQALAALRARARTWLPVRPLLPNALALAVEAEPTGGALLWRVAPNLPTLATHLSEIATTARIRLLEAFARTLGQALVLCLRKRILLDLHPDAYAVEQGRIVYVRDELTTGSKFTDVGPALLALPEQLADDPAIDVYIDALSREFTAFIETESDDLGLGSALGRARSRSSVASDARTRLIAALERG